MMPSLQLQKSQAVYLLHLVSPTLVVLCYISHLQLAATGGHPMTAHSRWKPSVGWAASHLKELSSPENSSTLGEGGGGGGASVS